MFGILDFFLYLCQKIADMVDKVTVSKEDALHLVCDFLKRNRILGEFVIASYDYHKVRGIFLAFQSLSEEIMPKP